MIRTPLLRRPPAPGKAPAFRHLFKAAPAALLACGLVAGALLTAGCGEDNQRVSEHFPSGARPAPVPAADLAAGLAELPPDPPAEPQLQAAPPAPNSPAAVPEVGQPAAPAAAASTPPQH